MGRGQARTQPRARPLIVASLRGGVIDAADFGRRLALGTDLDWDFADRIIRIKNMYLAPFYDVGDIYLDSKSVGGIAHALGVGIRADVMFFSFLERATIRLDVAKAINSNASVQYWFGLSQPF